MSLQDLQVRKLTAKKARQINGGQSNIVEHWTKIVEGGGSIIGTAAKNLEQIETKIPIRR